MTAALRASRSGGSAPGAGGCSLPPARRPRGAAAAPGAGAGAAEPVRLRGPGTRLRPCPPSAQSPASSRAEAAVPKCRASRPGPQPGQRQPLPARLSGQPRLSPRSHRGWQPALSRITSPCFSRGVKQQVPCKASPVAVWLQTAQLWGVCPGCWTWKCQSRFYDVFICSVLLLLL